MTVDLAEVAEDAVERWRDPAAEVGKSIDIGEREPARVFADPGDLAHVLDNLIENALRYCPPGTHITVATTTPELAPRSSSSTTGPGSGERARPRLRALLPGSNGRQIGPGTGLGLAIVSELVERWGGEVELLEGQGLAWWPPSVARLPIVDRGFTVSEERGCYGRGMRSLRNVLAAIVGLMLPIGLALAVYLASAGAIAATPEPLQISAERIAQPSSGGVKETPKKQARKERKRSADGSAASGTTTVDDHGGVVEPGDDNGGTSTGSDDNSGSGSSNSGSGSDDSGSNSGPGGGSDDD